MAIFRKRSCPTKELKRNDATVLQPDLITLERKMGKPSSGNTGLTIGGYTRSIRFFSHSFDRASEPRRGDAPTGFRSHAPAARLEAPAERDAARLTARAGAVAIALRRHGWPPQCAPRADVPELAPVPAGGRAPRTRPNFPAPTARRQSLRPGLRPRPPKPVRTARTAATVRRPKEWSAR